jgi:hypothetical protein
LKNKFVKIAALCATILLVTAPLALAFMPPESGSTTGTRILADQNIVLPKDTFHRGDMILAGGSITITGKIRGNVFVACGDLKITDFEIDGSLFVACRNADISAKIDGQVYVACGSLTDKSEVFGDFKVGSGSCVLSGKYNGEVDMAGGDQPGAVFDGFAETLNIAGGKVIIGNKAEVKGKINIAVPKNTSPTYPERFKDQITVTQFDDSTSNIADFLTIKDFIVGLIVAFLIGFFMFHFGRNKSERIVGFIKNSFFISLLWGLVVTVSVPIAVILILLILAPASIIPAIALIFVYLFAFYAGLLFFSHWIGELVLRLFNKTLNVYLTLTVGIIVTFGILFILAMIPSLEFMAMIIKITMAVSGFGAIILALFRKDQPVA